MPITYKVLGQSNPSATTATTVYAVPASSSAIVSTMTIANLAASAATFRIAVRPGGETLASKHYIAYDVTVAALDTLTLTLGLTLAATDVVTIYASTATMAFAVYGVEQ
jgi:glucose-6-phosphate dehydrogenase assembly protein OpcA